MGAEYHNCFINVYSLSETLIQHPRSIRVSRLLYCLGISFWEFKQKCSFGGNISMTSFIPLKGIIGFAYRSITITFKVSLAMTLGLLREPLQPNFHADINSAMNCVRDEYFVWKHTFSLRCFKCSDYKMFANYVAIFEKHKLFFI